ncbi:hypothetical protein EUX98_g914 [Antrodiella citrinella]|uniref:Pheromone n=1 Tax=Antrodiella citrinella TaxID=2447956 RepID=A0A4S4N4H8_9APHY|nr:hypothetical protein EUX98_g914 [Antrodiella citrinella]
MDTFECLPISEESFVDSLPEQSKSERSASSVPQDADSNAQEYQTYCVIA